jgi:hypothetical protein
MSLAEQGDEDQLDAFGPPDDDPAHIRYEAFSCGFDFQRSAFEHA